MVPLGSRYYIVCSFKMLILFKFQVVSAKLCVTPVNSDDDLCVLTVPSAVLDVQWSPLNSSTVRISWKEPQRSNGVIKNYELLVRGYAGSQHSVHCVNVSNSKLNTEVRESLYQQIVIILNTRY